MFSALLLAAVLPGQVQMRQRQCQTAASYQRQYVLQAAAPAYRTYATNYSPALVTTYFGPAYQDAYYSNIVGAQARIANRRQEDLASTAALTAQVGGLTVAISRLEARLGQPAPQPPPTPTEPAPQPVAPGKPTPDVPGKPAPDANPPPLPKTNPDDGSVPPPPPVPSVGSSDADREIIAQGTSILVQRCAKCHVAPAKSGKGVVLFSEPGKLANLGPFAWVKIDSQVYSGQMPSQGEPLSAEEYSKLRAMVNVHKPEIDAAIKACEVAAKAPK